MAAAAPRRAKPKKAEKAKTTPRREVRAQMRIATPTHVTDNIELSQVVTNNGFWRSDALPLGLIVLMLLVLFMFAAISR